MSKKLTGRALAELEANRDIWQEVLDGVREIKAGGGKTVVAEFMAFSCAVWTAKAASWTTSTRSTPRPLSIKPTLGWR